MASEFDILNLILVLHRNTVLGASDLPLIRYLDISIPNVDKQLSRGASTPNWRPESVAYTPPLSPYSTPRKQPSDIAPTSTSKNLHSPPPTYANAVGSAVKSLSFEDWLEMRKQYAPVAPKINLPTSSLNLEKLNTEEAEEISASPTKIRSPAPASPKHVQEDTNEAPLISPKTGESGEASVEAVECDLCVNKRLSVFRHEQHKDIKEEEIQISQKMREKVLAETLESHRQFDELRKQRTRDYQEEMSRLQTKRSAEKKVIEEEKSKDKERIDRLREGLEDLEFQQYASKRKQEYIRDLLEQMELNQHQRKTEKDTEKTYFGSAIFGIEDVDSKKRSKSEYKMILQKQMEYKQKEKEEAKQRKLDEERSLQEHVQQQAERTKEEQERRLKEIRKQFEEHIKEETRLKEKSKQEQLEEEHREREENNSMMKTFWEDQNRMHTERKVRDRTMGEALLKQMEQNAVKKQTQHHEEFEKSYEATVIKVRDPELMVCGGCQQTLPVSRFKGTPSHTLIKALQKYQKSKRAGWSTYGTTYKASTAVETSCICHTISLLTK